MRTKTLALSALLGMLGTASLVAQSNVYSVNAVGYINVTLYPGYNLITCPLIASPDNTIATLLNNSTGAYQVGTGHSALRAATFQYSNGVPGSYINADQANSTFATGGWAGGGATTINPGQAIWFQNPNPIGGAVMTATFVGTVPQNNTPTNFQLPNGLTNIIYPNYNLMGSIVPMSGDLATNSISLFGTNAASGTLSLGPTKNDVVFVYDPTPNGGGGQGGYSGYQFTVNPARTHFAWSPDPVTATVYEGFWYQSTLGTNSLGVPTNNYWVENFSINP
jgi:hypothetical protein